MGKLGKGEIDRIRALLGEGYNKTEVATKLGVNRKTVSAYAVDTGPSLVQVDSGKVSPHDFPQELMKIYGDDWRILYALFRRLFDSLYTACIIEGRALLLHGGIPTEADCLEDIAKAHLTYPLTSHLEEILWNDPSTLLGVNYSFRGSGKMFGVDIASSFLNKVGVETLIRGHECFDDGYHFHDGKILTLFSCKLPQYRNRKLAYLQMPLNLDFDRNTLQRHLHQL